MDTESQPGKKFQKELNSGTVALILLAVIDQAPEPLYGYLISKRVERLDPTVAMMKQGALYPVLRSLEAGGLLASRVEPSVSGPPRRYYSITPAGRSTLGEWRAIWTRTRTLVDAILEGGTDDSKR